MAELLEISINEASLSRLEQAAAKFDSFGRALGEMPGFGQGGGSMPQSTFSSGAGGPTAGSPGLGGPPGSMSQMLTGMAAFGLVLNQATAALDRVVHGLNAAGDAFTTASRKFTSTLESVPILGSIAGGVRSFGEAMHGHQARLRMQAFEGTIDEAQALGGLDVVGRSADLAARRAGLAGVAGERRRQMLLLQGGGFGMLTGVDDPASLSPMLMDRFSRQVGIAQSRLGHEAELQGHERQAAALAAERKALDERSFAATRRLNDAHFRERDAIDALGGQGGLDRAKAWSAVTGQLSPAMGDLDKAQRDRILAEKELGRIVELTGANAERAQQTALGIAQTRHSLAVDELAKSKEQLGVLREQRGILQGSAGSFFMHHPAQRQLAMNWVRMAKEQGPEHLHPRMWDDISGTFGQAGQLFVQRMHRQMADRDPAFREAMRELDLPELAGGDLDPAGNLRQQLDLEKKIVEMASRVEAGATRGFEEAFGRFVGRIIDAMAKQMAHRVGEIEGGLRMRNIGGGN